ncbi:MAG: PorT family protein [bacterium]|nr:PorT family protein [bacterium]
MRFKILAILLTLALACSATAAGNFGVKGGGVLANLTGSDIEGGDTKFGFAGGVFMRAPIGKSGTMTMQPEVLYVMKGTQEEEQGVTVKLKFDYIEIPILVKFNLSTEGQFRPNLFVGPAVAFKMSSKASAEGVSVDIDDVKALDFGLSFGGGFDLAMASGSAITFDARYTVGLTNVPDVDPSPNVKNSALMFMLGYLF